MSPSQNSRATVSPIRPHFISSDAHAARGGAAELLAVLCQPGSPPACLARSGVPEREHGQTDFKGPAGGREKAPNATRRARDFRVLTG